MTFIKFADVEYRLEDLKSIQFNKNNSDHPYHLDFGHTVTDTDKSGIAAMRKAQLKKKFIEGFIASIPGLAIALISVFFCR